MLIEGKSLQELMDALSAGGFGKLVREKIDTRYGLEDPEMQNYEIRIRYNFSASATHSMVIEAISEDEAKKLARAQFNDEILDFDCSYADVTYFDITDVDKL